MALVLLHRFGEIVYLTRLDRVLDPVRMATRSFSLWNPYWDLGALHFQTVGYWIPFDLFFGLGRVLHVAPWLTERIYIATLLIVAVFGFVRLADALQVGRPGVRILAGLAYASAPVILSRVGWQSVGAMGAVFLPWTLTPLVRGSIEGSTRRAAARSAVAVALIGGANASVTLAIVPVPLLYLLTRRRSPRRASLLRWWIVATVMATSWWLVGLYFYARYGPDVLVYTEQVSVTVAATPVFEVLRGTADWVFALPAENSPAGSALDSRSLPILATTIVAAMGLAGLSRRDLPERTFLVLCLLTGVAAVGGGIGGLFGSPLADTYRSLLGGVLAAFRNVFKFQPLVSLPLSLGVAHLLSGFDQARRLERAHLRRIVAVVTVVVIAAAAYPLWSNKLTRGPGFSEIPAAWQQTGDYLASSATGRVLVVPGIPEAEFDWGFSSQLPIQWGSDVTWATRSQTPLSGVESVQYLDAIELVIERGGDSGLPDYLRRGGFSTIVVPNDQLSADNGAPMSEVVRRALLASGLERTIGFGPRSYGLGELQQVELYSVPGSDPVQAYPATAATWLSGDIGSTLNVPGDIFGDRPYILVKDGSPEDLRPLQWLITDGNQAHTTSYGFSRNNRSYIYGRNDAPSGTALDANVQTVQSLSGIRAITASTVGPGIAVSNSPASQPANIVDGDVQTAWQPLRYRVGGSDIWGSTDPWVDIEFEQARQVDSLTINLLLGYLGTPAPIEVTTRTDVGAAVSVLDAMRTSQRLKVVPGLTSHIRISISHEAYDTFGDVIGIAELAIPGPPPIRRLDVPSELSTEFGQPWAPDPAWVFTRNRPSIRPLVSLNSEAQLARTFDVPKAAQFAVIAAAAAEPSAELVWFLGLSPTLAVAADSTWTNDPRVGPRNLVDGDFSTVWRSATTTDQPDPTAVVALGWEGDREVSGFRLAWDERFARPDSVTVHSGDEVRVAEIAPDGSVAFPGLTGNRLDVILEYAESRHSSESHIIGLSAIEVPALADLYPGPPDLTTPYRVSCDDGLAVTVDTIDLAFSVDTTIGSLVSGERVALSPCRTDTLDLTTGPHTLAAASGATLLTVQQVVIGNEPVLSSSAVRPRVVSVSSWGTTRRIVDVGPGEKNLLVVNEIFNAGWHASLDGRDLEPVRVDGWRQGFVVPAGEGGRVGLSFTPDRVFKIGTVAGLVALLALGAVAIWPDRKRYHPAESGEGRPSIPLLVSLATVGAIWCVGIAALVLPVLWLVRATRRAMLPWIAFGALAVAGILVVRAKSTVEHQSDLWGTASWPVSALAAISLLTVISTLLPARLAAWRSRAPINPSLDPPRTNGPPTVGAG